LKVDRLLEGCVFELEGFIMKTNEAKPLRILIVGGVAGGATAAARAARVNPRAEIIIFEKGPAVSFANCGLPYHIGGEIAQREKLLVATAELFRKRFGIEVRTGHEVIAIDRREKTITVRPVGEEEYQQSYDRLILAPGAEPMILPNFPKNASNFSSLWTLADMDRIIKQVQGSKTKRAIVIGGGFVGLEIAEQLVRIAWEVTLIERDKQVLAPLDPEMAAPIADELQKHGVSVNLGVSIAEFRQEGDRVSAVTLDDGRELETDLVIAAVGVKPRVALAVGCGLDLGSHGGIKVNEQMQTSDPDIFAVGDAVEYFHQVMQGAARVPLAGPANRAGRVAGTVAAGGQAKMSAVLGTAIVRVFDKTAAGTGFPAKWLDRLGMEYRSVIIEAANHASYFPGAVSLQIKLIYAPVTGKILGAQAVGGEGVDKRIDVIATAMSFGGTVDDLAGLDLAYAPPFGSAKDPVHMAAFAASNDLQQAPEMLATFASLEGLQVVDVRESAELQRLPLAGAVHIPVDQIAQRMGELDSTRPTVTVCHSGKRAHVAACILKGNGFEQVQNLTGGMSVRSRLK
jgi:NADPH-dependent 2,4-dienoyl-CoA reductase/sulfur reductase-like enzyme/rhodanese-related sulfurtransferase